MSAAAAEADAASIRALAEEILARREYSRANLELEPPRWLEWAADRLSELLDWINAIYVDSPVLYWLFMAGLLVVLAGLIAHMAWSISLALVDQAPKTKVREGTKTDFRSMADGLADEGRYLEAAHQLWLGCLQQVAGSEVIELQPDDTNGVALERLQASSLSERLRSELLELVRTTERVWFRDRSNDRNLYERWARAYGELLGETS